MSLQLNGSNQYAVVASAVKSSAPLTIVGWAKTSTPTTAQAYLDIHNPASDTNRNTFYAANSPTSNLQAATANATTLVVAATTGNLIGSGVWYQFICEFASASSRAAYLNNGTPGTNTTSLVPVSVGRTTIGARNGNTTDLYFAGLLSHIAVYSRVLTADERALLQLFRPSYVAPGSLLAYWPLISSVNDALGTYNMTPVGSPTFSTDSPPISVAPMPASLPSRRDRRRIGYVDMRLG